MGTLKDDEERVTHEIEVEQQAAAAASSQIDAARQMIEKANALLAVAEPAYVKSKKRLDILTAESVALVREETTTSGKLEDAKTRLDQSLALSETGLRQQAWTVVEAKKNKILSDLESKLHSYIPK